MKKNIVLMIIMLIATTSLCMEHNFKALEAKGWLPDAGEAKKLYGYEKTDSSVQALCDKASKKMGIHKKYSVYNMNFRTQRDLGFSAIFIMPWIRSLWVNPVLSKQKPDFILYYEFLHEMAHVMLMHHLKRDIESHSALGLGILGCMSLCASKLPFFSVPNRFRFLKFGTSTTIGSLGKCLFEQTASYESLVKKWYKSQEKDAHQKALSLHDDPNAVIAYYQELNQK